MLKALTATVLLMLAAKILPAQGSLAPAGTPAPLMKSLDQVFDSARGGSIAVDQTNTPGAADASYVISQAGSYYLPKSFTGESGKSGIKITATGVTLDLRGNTITGVAGGVTGVRSDALGCCVRNGTLAQWPEGGIRLGGASRIQGITAINCSNYSLYASYGSLVSDCLAVGAASTAVKTGPASRVERCVVNDGNGGGVEVDSTCVVRDCVVYAVQFGGIYTGGTCCVQDNMVGNCGSAAISVCGGSTIRGNNVSTSQSGIELRCGGSVASENVIAGNTTGVSMSNNNKEQVFKNTFRGNTTNVTSSGGNYVAPIVVVSSATNPFSNLLAQ